MQIPAPDTTEIYTNIVTEAGHRALSKRVEKYRIPIICEKISDIVITAISEVLYLIETKPCLSFWQV